SRLVSDLGRRGRGPAGGTSPLSRGLARFPRLVLRIQVHVHRRPPPGESSIPVAPRSRPRLCYPTKRTRSPLFGIRPDRYGEKTTIFPGRPSLNGRSQENSPTATHRWTPRNHA